MHKKQKISIVDLEYEIETAGMLARFDKPMSQSEMRYLLGDGFKDSADTAARCLRWIWHQWLAEAPCELIRAKVESFVKRGLVLREMGNSYYKLPEYDLLLLHCAILACREDIVIKVAEEVGDFCGAKDDKPTNTRDFFPASSGDLYAAAWCGMLKNTILGNQKTAIEQSKAIWEAHRDRLLFAAPKSLVFAWLNKDWEKFIEQQRKDFNRLWGRIHKDAWSIRSESATEIVIRTNAIDTGNMWCWAHCALALLAYRQGIQIETDSFWFPAHALKCA